MELETKFEFVTNHGQCIDVHAKADVNDNNQKLINLSLQFTDPYEGEVVEVNFDRDTFKEIEELALNNLQEEISDIVPVDTYMEGYSYDSYIES